MRDADAAATAAAAAAAPGAAVPRMAGLRDAALISVVHSALAGAVAWVWLALIGAERGVLEAIACVAPALLAVGLSFTSQQDRRQYVVRLLACSAMLPILLMMWAGSQHAPAGAASAWPALGWVTRPWLFFSASAVVHALLFVGTVWWLAASVTRVEAAAGAGRAGKALLGQRLQSLAAAGVPVDVSAGAHADQWLLNIRLPASPGRSHRVVLDIDEPAGQVLVRERLGVVGAAPQGADEASLRGPADAPFDPARPDAQKVSGRSIQATMVEPDKVAAVRLALVDGRVQLVGVAPSEPEAIVNLLCALVTRSGYAWQPVLGRLGRALRAPA